MWRNYMHQFHAWSSKHAFRGIRRKQNSSPNYPDKWYDKNCVFVVLLSRNTSLKNFWLLNYLKIDDDCVDNLIHSFLIWVSENGTTYGAIFCAEYFISHLIDIWLFEIEMVEKIAVNGSFYHKKLLY